MKKVIFILTLILSLSVVKAQVTKTISGKIYDSLSKEPVSGATVSDAQHHTSITDAEGKFTLTTDAKELTISSINYKARTVLVGNSNSFNFSVSPVNNDLEAVVVSASRIAEKRTEAPIAISTISQQTIKDAKANRLDYLVNKVSGVFMVNLQNEQHEMSIRQPLTTRSLFLYLEVGVPIRTTGIYNHNALLEMNMVAAKQIEIIKGPASSLYGAEAIGGAVNIITQAPPALANANISVQGTDGGYKRIDAQAGNTLGKFGLLVSGYYANRTNGPVDQTDFHKTAFTVRGDYKINNKTSWNNSITYVDYYSQMGGGSLDSAHFAQKNYNTLYTFNNRTVTALRVKSQLVHQWYSNSESQLTAAYRDNAVKQNPSYYVTNNYRNSALANGQLNNSSFKSYMLIGQHVQRFNWLKSKLIAGISVDVSPSTYVANYIKIQRNSAGKYISFINTDSLLSNYKTGISNIASYASYELSPAKGLKIVTALRYDYYHYDFQNYLSPSASTGAPSTVNNFNRFTPKIGATYNYKHVGFYANYSQGYVPPQVTELFNSVKVPYLQPQTFFNYEIGGWINILDNKLYADYSLYLLEGTNEIISVRQDDGTYQNQNAGKTKHQGIEYGITYKPTSQWQLRFSATNAKHTFVKDVEKGIDYSGNEIAGAPHFISNAEVTYKPAFAKGLRIGVEWQHLSSYYLNNANSGKYGGFDVFNIRAGYNVARFEVWVNTLNAFNKYYSILASKSTYGYSYSLGDPRETTLGVSYHFGK